MKRFHHRLYIMKVTKGSKGKHGFDTDGKSEYVYYCDCYEQRLGKAMVFEHENGKSTSCQSKVFLPQDVVLLESGITIQIREADGETIRTQGSVNGPVKDVKHSRFWV